MQWNTRRGFKKQAASVIASTACSNHRGMGILVTFYSFIACVDNNRRAEIRESGSSWVASRFRQSPTARNWDSCHEKPSDHSRLRRRFHGRILLLAQPWTFGWNLYSMICVVLFRSSIQKKQNQLVMFYEDVAFLRTLQRIGLFE